MKHQNKWIEKHKKQPDTAPVVARQVKKPDDKDLKITYNRANYVRSLRGIRK